MDTVKVDRLQLLEMIEANRRKHIEDYNAALIVYRQKAIDELITALDMAEAGGKITRHLDSPEPKSYEKEYDVCIKLLKFSVENTIELDVHQFRQYVMDEWTWSQTFETHTKAYNVLR